MRKMMMPTIGPRIGTKFTIEGDRAPQYRIGDAAQPHDTARQQRRQGR